MARTEINQPARHRILSNVRGRLSVDREQATPRDGDGAGMAPSAPRTTTGPRSRGKGSLTALAAGKLLLLALVIVAGVAVIFWLRDLGEAFGINWIGD